MAGRKLDMEALQMLSLFEKITKSRVKDSVEFKEKLTFIVEEGQLWRALGKDRVNLIKLEELLKRRVKIIEYRKEKIQFLVNLIHPLRVKDIQEDEEGVITITGTDTKTKGLLIGSRAQNLRATEEVMRMYFECKEIKVI